MKTKYDGLPVDSELYQLARDEVLTKITIPQYFLDNIDSGIDLSKTPRCLCPFHEEDTPSFRFNADESYWRCFGGCKVGGTVIDLHKHKHGIRGHYEALMHLRDTLGRVYGLKFKNFFLDVSNTELTLDELLLDKPKKGKSLSLTEFMATNKEKSKTTIMNEINNQLRRLKAQDRDKYIEACILVDYIHVSMIKDSKAMEGLLNKLKEW